MTSRKVQNNARKLKLTGIWIILMLFFISELLFYTWCRVQCVGIGYEISNVTNHQKELTALKSNLKVELTSLKSPARITEIAINQLGLTMPKPKQMIIIP